MFHHATTLSFLVFVTFFGLCQAQCPDSIQGVSYPDLPKLTNSGPSGGDWTLTGSDNNQYNWNICALQTSCPNQCGTPGTVACQNCATNSFSTGILSTQSIQVTLGINSVNFLYGQGAFSSGCGINRSSNISVACSTIPVTSAVAVNAAPFPACYYNMIMASSLACAGPVTPPTQLLSPDQVPAMADMQAQWGKQLGWTGNSSTAACSWSGVSCTQVGIYWIVNSIDVSASGLSGAIPESISAISSLVYFNCSQNPLIGGPAPSGLGDIRSLKFVDMSYSGLSGTLPFNLQTQKLSTLAVTSNKLTGPVQTTICNIKNYNLQGNMWNCPLPACCGENGNYLCIPCVSNSSP